MNHRAVSLLGIFTLMIGLCFNDVSFGEVKDIYGWNKARWGMTEEEIRSALKEEVVRLDKAVTTGDGNYFTLETKNAVEIGDIKLRAFFVMDKQSKKLKAVRLKPIEKSHYGDLASPSDFRSLEALLTEKYGAPLHKSTTDDPRRNIDLVSRWVLPSTVIQLSFFEQIARKDVMGIRLFMLEYSQRSAKDTDKL